MQEQLVVYYYMNWGDNMDKISRTILTFLLGRAKIIYREYFTSKQISQIDSIIWKLDNIEELQKTWKFEKK